VGTTLVNPNAFTVDDGNGGANYNVTLQSAAGSITAKALTVSGLTGTNRTYDGTVVDALSGTAILSGLVNTESFALNGQSAAANALKGTLASKNAGTQALTTSLVLGAASNGAAASNYALAQPALADVVIAQAQLTVTGTTVANKTYDGLNMAELSGGSLVGVVANDTVSLTQTGTFADKNVGTGKAVTVADTLTGADSGNYTLTQPGNLTATVRAKGILLAELVAQDKSYDGNTTATISNWGVLSGLIGNETLTFNQGTASFADAAVGQSKTVTATGYSIADGANGGIAKNYELPTATSAIASIVAAKKTVADIPPPSAVPVTALPQPSAPTTPALPALSTFIVPSGIPTTNTSPQVSPKTGTGEASAEKNNASGANLVSNATSGIAALPVQESGAPTTDLVTVFAPNGVAATGVAFSFALPSQIAGMGATTDKISVESGGGLPLPAWLQFNPDTKTFTALAVPDGAFPMQVIVTVNGQRSTIAILEREDL
jgi:hypothetical protein